MKSIVELITTDWQEFPIDKRKEITEDYMDEVIEGIPVDIAKKAIFHISLGLNRQTVKDLQEEFLEYGTVWWTRHHHRPFGVNVRNMLRDLVCKDEELPTGHWEDYYPQLIEVVIGMRRVEALERDL